MTPRNKPRYTEEELATARHFRVFANYHRTLLLDVLIEWNNCRVTQLVMETGLSYRQAYYQLTLLRKIGYVSCTCDKGRYVVRLARGWHEAGALFYATVKSLTAIRESADNVRPSTTFASNSFFLPTRNAGFLSAKHSENRRKFASCAFASGEIPVPDP